MLQAIRSRASSIFVKVLFGLLIVTFGLWGIGDIFRNRNVDTTVATVGDRTITIDQVNQAVQSDPLLQRLRSALGTVDPAQAKQLGIVDGALQRLVDNDLVDLEIDHLGLAVGDEAIREAILRNPNFHNESGAFDRGLYDRVLALNHMTEPQFEAMARQDMLRGQLTGALVGGVTPPKPLVDALYRSRAERRTADLVTLPPSAAGTIPTPSEAELDAFYKSHEDSFRAPERRSFTLATLRLEDIAAGITVPEDTLKQEYDSRQDEFHTPEQRQVQQMLLPDEATAKAAAAQLAAGKDFATVAKEVAKADPADLGWMKRDDLPPDIANAVFALKAGENSAPIKSSFGWHIMHLVAVKPEQTQSFEQVKDKLAKEVARDEAGDRIADVANHIDDALAGGAGFDDVVQKFGLKRASFADLDSDGHLPAGGTAALPQPAATILQTAFATDSGQMSQLNELGDDGYYLLKVDKVTPAAVKPLAQVHDQAVKLWQADARATALQKLADEIAHEVDGGKSLKEVAAARHLTVSASPPLPRSGGNAEAPPALVAKLFDAKQGQAVTAPAGETYMVAQLTGIEPADPAKDQAAVKQLSDQLAATMQSDMLSEFEQALHRNFPVEVNQANLERVL